MTSSTRPTITGPISHWGQYRDDYGRSCHRAYNADMRTLGVVAKIPFTKSGEPRAYLCNDWTNPVGTMDACVTYHPTLKAAKAHLDALVRPVRFNPYHATPAEVQAHLDANDTSVR